VLNIQSKIVVAKRTGNLIELFKLQTKLITSFEARCLAVRQVTTNDGAKSPGIDGIVWDSPKAKMEAVSKLILIILSAKSYIPQRIRRV
jgi:RNA-directed DNA polymerase